jgi:hypothetical protein
MGYTRTSITGIWWSKKGLTPTDKKLAFKKALKRGNITKDDIEDNLSKQTFILEKELGVYIDENYPLLKFLTQYEILMWYKEQEAKASKKKASTLR